jgi:hypothetical protein
MASDPGSIWSLASRGDIAGVGEKLRGGVSADVQNGDGQTAAHFAARGGTVSAMQGRTRGG